MRKTILRKLSNFENLSEEEIKETIKDIVSEKSTEGQIGAFIMGLKMKGETVEEITAAAEIFRELATKVVYPNPEELLDTAGTGGDKVDTFNVSTMTAFVAAAAGAKVAKHGNRAVSSKCGSADFLEALGANIELSPQQVLKLLEEVNIAFLFAPLYHPAMKRVAKVRRELGIRSLFNLVGPLSNPVGAKRQVVGVYDYSLVEKLANVLRKLGLKKAYVVYGLEGLDEVSITGETLVGEVNEGEVSVYKISPEDLGLRKHRLEDVKGGDCKRNVEIFYQILEGENEPARDFLLINSAFALNAAGIGETLKDSLKLAREVIEKGKVKETVEKFVKLTHEV